MTAALAVSAHAAPKTAAPAAPAFQAPAGDWRAVDPENVLVIDTTKGRVMVELQPLAAPNHVARMKELARAHFYDGLKFHRVIDDFMAQTGDPLGTGEGGSQLPDLEPEFRFRRDASMSFTPVALERGFAGFLGSLPIQTQPDDAMVFMADRKVWAWGLFCPGVAGAARAQAENSANSQFYLMRSHYPTLETLYTAWGRAIVGLDVIRALKTGEPVIDPDLMTKVQVLADMPDRPKVQVLDTKSASFAALVAKVQADRGSDFSICDVDIPAQVK